MNNYQRIARSIWRQRGRFFCSSSSSSSSSSPCLLMPPAIDDKGLIIMPPSSSCNKNKAAKGKGGCLNMYNLIEKRMISVPKLGPGAAVWKADILCPETTLCVGSSNGWLAFVNPHNQSLFLLNPNLINNNSSASSSISYIPLPPVETLPYNKGGYRMFKSDHRSATPSLIPYFLGSFSETGGLIQKLLISMPPSKSNSCIPIPASDEEKGGRPYNNINNSNSNLCFVVALKDRNISYCLLGDKQWYDLDNTPIYEDIIYSPRKNTLFAIEQSAENHHDCTAKHVLVYTWDFTDPFSPKKQSPIRTSWLLDDIQYRKKKKETTLDGYSFERRYLVESQEGDLFQVVRYVVATSFYVSTKRDYYLEMPYRTVSFDVYKLVNKDNTWKHMKTLGDHRAIFVGLNSSYCLDTTGNCDQHLIKGNCIYYTDDSDNNVINVASDDQRRGRGHDFGIFDYGAYKHNQDQHDFILNETSSIGVKEFLSPPVWVIPPETTTIIPKNSCYNCRNKCVGIGTPMQLIRRNTTCQYK